MNETNNQKTDDQETIKKEPTKRIEIIDALRGLSVTLMVFHHFFYNLAQFLGFPWWIYRNPVFNILSPFFAGLLIFLSGVSSRFSRGNISRGAIAMVISMLITYVTVRMDMPIWFGVLHLLSFSMLFFGITQKFWDIIPKKAAPIIFITVIITTALLREHITLTTNNIWLHDIYSLLGWPQEGFISLDYFPILPWLFVFLLGTWAGIYIKERKLPEWFYEAKFPIFPAVGRKALIIYVLHQPVLYGIVMLILYFRQ